MFTVPYGFIGGGVTGPPWEYTSLSEAESSEDAWGDGDEVTITGGPTFTYLDNLAVSGYSGLIHKYPWDGTGTLGTVSSVTVRLSENEGVDPDSWTNWTDSSDGVKGTDYEFDTDSGLARIRDLTTAGRAVYISDVNVETTTDTATFMVLDKLTATNTGSGSDKALHARSLRAYVGAGNNRYIRLDGTNSLTDHNWYINHTDSSTYTESGIDRTNENRLYVYVKDGRWALWDDTGSTPDISGTTPRTVTSTALTDLTVGYVGFAGVTFTETQGRIVAGKVVTS